MFNNKPWVVLYMRHARGTRLPPPFGKPPSGDSATPGRSGGGISLGFEHLVAYPSPYRGHEDAWCNWACVTFASCFTCHAMFTLFGASLNVCCAADYRARGPPRVPILGPMRLPLPN